MSSAPHLPASRFVAGPITPTLLRFAWPLLATNLLHAAASTWSAVWIGQVLGSNALAAVATATVLVLRDTMDSARRAPIATTHGGSQPSSMPVDPPARDHLPAICLHLPGYATPV